MSRINPDHGWQKVEKHLEKIRDPRRRAVLSCVRDHFKAEAEGDFSGMLDTLAPDPNYHFWVEGNGFGGGPKGRGAVQAHYEGLFQEGRHVCDWDIDRIVVDEDAVYALRVRMVILWPVDENAKLVGEDGYMNGSMYAPENLRQLSAEEVPGQFYELARRSVGG
jgi:hypothetical protein